jgi:predicted phosphoribosyltransferase
MNKEYAIGAVSLADYFVLPHDDVSDEYVEQEVRAVRSRLKEMQNKYHGSSEPVSLKDKIVIVIDDGIATGNTLLGTIHLLNRSKPSKIVIAVPVASQSAVRKLSEQADEMIALMTPKDFYGVGQFYENFEHVSDEEVVSYLKKLEKSGNSGQSKH